MNWFGGFNYLNVFKKQTPDNPKFETFKKLENDEDAMRRSVIEQLFKDGKPDTYTEGLFTGYDTSSYADFVYGAASTSKAQRLQNYRRMACFPEVCDAIEEIAEAMENYNTTNQMITVEFRNPKITDYIANQLRDEFYHLVELIDLENNFFDYAKTFIVDGQLCWENIIDDNEKEKGIIGFNLIPNESYDFLVNANAESEGVVVRTKYSKGPTIDPNGNQVQGNIDVQAFDAWKAKQKGVSDDGEEVGISEVDGIPLPWNQVTYCDSGVYNSNKLVVYPVLERARKTYRQLSLIEDSIIIYRLVRAPERFVFNVGTGKLPRDRAEQEVFKMMKRYQTKRFYNPVTGTVSNDYDPFSMLENFWFAKPEGGGGTEVTNLNSAGVNWTDLPDLEYFHKKLYLSLKIPYSRFNIKQDSITVLNADTLSYEELRFCKFVIRLQSKMAVGFHNAFVTHLKLKGLWEQYDLGEKDIKVAFVKPHAYDIYRNGKIVEMQMAAYEKLTSNHDEISKTKAQKQCLGWSDIECEENKKLVDIEQMRIALSKYRAAAIEKNGTYIEATTNPEPEDSNKVVGDEGKPKEEKKPV